MKKQKLVTFIKSKELYLVILFCFVSLFIGSAIMISVNDKYSKGDNNKNYVDLNEPIQEAKITDVEQAVTNNIDATVANSTEVKTKNVEPELSVGVNENKEIEITKTDLVKNDDVKTEKKEEQAVETMSTSVGVKEPENTVTVFNATKGLIWPIQGDVLLPFSMEHLVYFETLEQYRCNPAMLIKGMVGKEVKSAANGVVENISFNEETGNTLVINHGSNYKTIYGQLKNVKVDIGDKVNADEIIANIEKPTKYYITEGSHLYFEVLKNDKPIDPKSLLN